MSTLEYFDFSDGRRWYVGSGIAWSETIDPACILIPANQIEGLDDAEIGRRVRALVPSARQCVIDEDAANRAALNQLNQRNRQRQAAAGYIYLIRSDHGYKIGRTKTIPKRIESIGLQLPFPIELIHTIPTDDAVATERYLHAAFEIRRINGEWFQLTSGDVDWICEQSDDSFCSAFSH